MKIVNELIEKYLKGHSKDFIIEEIQPENGCDTWELDTRDNKIVLKGNNAGSVAAALGYYLKYTVKANLSWCGKRIPDFVGKELPMPQAYKRVIKQKYRVYMNYCTHSYSAAWWNWDRWEYEIDMMALNGINMPLAVTGTEGVWYDTLLELGFTDIEARSFLVGPAFLAWQLMTNIEGHGGPLPKAWIDEHVALGQKIIARELEFGMKPIQQGYSGFVPNLMKEKFKDSKFLIKKTWNNIGHTTEIDPLDPLFKKVGEVFMNNQRKLFGAHGFYACDPFHEGTPPVDGDEYLNTVGKTISDFYYSFDKNYIWVMQAWSIRKQIATAVDKKHMLILDLDCQFPVEHEGYWGYDYVVGRLHNFGARMSSLHGDMHLAAENGFIKAKQYAKAAVGAGVLMEGIGQNPAFYDLSLEMLTRPDSVDVYEWVKGYIERRYAVTGDDKEKCFKAWKLLLDKIYIKGTDYVERGTVICTRPCLKLRGTGPCDTFEIHYDNKVLLEIISLLKTVKCDTEGFKYDISDFSRQLISNYAQKLYAELKDAYCEKRFDDFKAKKREFLELLDDMDDMLSSRPEWTLQKWIADARSHGTTEEEKNLYEYNARMQVTIWGNEEESLLFDYAWKEWAGLIKSYYKPRWEKFFKMLEAKAEQGFDYPKYEDTLKVFENRIVWNADEFYINLGKWESAWEHNTEPIPLGNTAPDKSFELIEKYKDRI